MRLHLRDRDGADVKLYVAGNGRQADSDRTDYETGARNRLLSYAFLGDWADLAFQFWVDQGPESASVFLDSGAFSAMSRGATIDLVQYCDYVSEHERALACYAALDVIGDWRATQRNLELIVARGLTPVPTFHRGSPWEVLDELAGAFPYIALGGMVGTDGGRGSTAAETLRPHLDHCWRVLQRHWPVKVHVFGIATQWVLERYPFYSADSASAIMGAGMGRVQRFSLEAASPQGGRMVSRAWTDDVRETWDGVVADGVGRVAAGEGKSESAHAGRRMRNIQATLGLERYLTDMWRARGVEWKA